MAHRCIYDKRLDTDVEGYNALLEVWKERLIGGTAGKKIKLYYDVPTMRLYSNEKDLYEPYSWEKDCEIKYPEELESRLVCNYTDETRAVFG
jgi:hypothetical protein